MRPGRLGAVLVLAGAVTAAVTTGGCATPCSSSPGSCETGTPVAEASATASDDVVCRHEPMTGSHIVERRCYRRSEMVEREARDRAFMDRLIIQANRPQRNPASGTPNPQ